jgi:uncharacterized protein involved in response to NO
MQKTFFENPLWLVGFRPFFILAFVSGALLPMFWAGFYLGWFNIPTNGIVAQHWHAHEMLFGFAWAVLAGFLLTASKNWVKIRGMHGPLLAFAVLLWCLERLVLLGLLLDRGLFPVSRYILANGSVILVCGYVVFSLVRYRQNDSFKDNYFFILVLPFLILAKTLMLTQDWYLYGWSLALGLFRVAFAVMFERTMTQFMKSTEGIQLLRNKYLDASIKISVFLSAFSAWFPDIVAASIMLMAGILLFVRWIFWRPDKGFRNFGNAVMYLGYFGLSLHLVMAALNRANLLNLGTIPTHVFTFLCMGVVISGMLIRISQGHTGRPISFTVSDRFAIGMMVVASFFRLIAPIFWPQMYVIWIGLSALGWFLCFVFIGVRLTPFLINERVDGKVH